MVRQQSQAASGTAQAIAPDVYWLEVGAGYDRSNVYFVRSNSGWVLVDAALPNFGALICSAAESLFGPNCPPDAILLTHDHPDHAGSVRELARLWGCPVYIHPGEWPIVTLHGLATLEMYGNPIDQRIILPMLRLLPPQRVTSMLSAGNLADVVQPLDPDAPLPGLPDWTCVPTPGHTPGHIACFRHSDRVLISGDALVTVDLNTWHGAWQWVRHRATPCIAAPPWYSTWSRPLAAASIALLAGLAPCVVASGHGAPLDSASVADTVYDLAVALV